MSSKKSPITPDINWISNITYATSAKPAVIANATKITPSSNSLKF